MNTQTTNDFWLKAYDAFTGSTVIIAIIVTLIFFNIYEFTELGNRFKMSLGWRSALLIGALCGFFGDRIVAAIQGFIGK